METLETKINTTTILQLAKIAANPDIDEELRACSAAQIYYGSLTISEEKLRKYRLQMMLNPNPNNVDPIKKIEIETIQEVSRDVKKYIESMENFQIDKHPELAAKIAMLAYDPRTGKKDREYFQAIIYYGRNHLEKNEIVDYTLKNIRNGWN